MNEEDTRESFVILFVSIKCITAITVPGTLSETNHGQCVPILQYSRYFFLLEHQGPAWTVPGTRYRMFVLIISPPPLCGTCTRYQPCLLLFIHDD
jgi:hypothetical protein